MTAAFHFEAKKYSLRQAKDGVIVSFVVHPSDVAAELLSAPIGEHYVVALAPYSESPPAPKVEEPKPKGNWHSKSRAQRAGILCGKPAFQSFLGVRSTITDDMTAKQIEEMRANDAARHLRQRLGITSRRQIDDHEETSRLYDEMERRFFEATGQETEMRG